MKAKKSAKSISERKYKKVWKAISAKDMGWQTYFKDLTEQVVSLSKAAHLDTESIAKVKTQIASLPLTTLPILKQLVDTRAGQRPLPLSPLKVRHCL
jgi:hypothetical protein